MRADRTFCRICEAACGLEVERVGDGSIALRPDRSHPVSRGFVCAKGTRFDEVAMHPDRVLRPRIRDASGARAVSWDDALAEVARRVRPILEEHGPHSVALYTGNPLAFHAMGQIAAVLFGRALGSRNLFSASSQDCNNKFAGATLMHGTPVLHPIPDFEHTDLAILFGTNPAVSQSSFVHLPEGSRVFDRLHERGARTVFVDVRETESAKRWGELVLVRPGTDVWLILALLALVAKDFVSDGSDVVGLERLLALARTMAPERASAITGVPVETIEALAQSILRSPSTALHMSVGVNFGPFGTLAYVALQALAYVSGNYDRRGGSVFSPAAVLGSRSTRAAGFFTSDAKSRIGNFPTVFDGLPAGVLADEILTGGPERVRALFVIAGDPVRSIPGASRLEEAIARLDALVCVDLFENRTSSQAHVLLPATSWLERADFALPGLPLQTSELMQWTGRMMPPRGEARSEPRILAELARAIGRPLFGSELANEIVRRAPLDALLERGVDVLSAILDPQSRLRGWGLPIPAPEPGTYLGRGPLTAGHVVRFWHPALDGEAARLSEWEARLRSREGLVLIGRRRRLGHNAWLHGGVHAGKPESEAWMSRADMKARGLRDGTSIVVRSEAGELALPVRAKDGVQDGTIVVPHGELAMNVNEVIPAGVSNIEPASGQLVMTGIPVEVAALHAHAHERAPAE